MIASIAVLMKLIALGIVQEPSVIMKNAIFLPNKLPWKMALSPDETNEKLPLLNWKKKKIIIIIIIKSK